MLLFLRNSSILENIGGKCGEFEGREREWRVSLSTVPISQGGRTRDDDGPKVVRNNNAEWRRIVDREPREASSIMRRPMFV